mmetsp:Transcript_27432/g.81702  ORF Transcript_27432/g.81702 Transcript_27432/m.81702 type:complete len:252 (+) Transcript_27432:1589-2344(+)
MLRASSADLAMFSAACDVWAFICTSRPWACFVCRLTFMSFCRPSWAVPPAFLAAVTAPRLSDRVSSAAFRDALAAVTAVPASTMPCARDAHLSSAALNASSAVVALSSATLSRCLASSTSAATASSPRTSDAAAGAGARERALKSLAPAASQSPSQPSSRAPSSTASSLMASSLASPNLSRSSFLLSPMAGSPHSKRALISLELKMSCCWSAPSAICWRPILKTWSLNILSSMSPLVMRRYTRTSFSWPMR